MELSEERVVEIILSKLHGHTRKQWDEELKFEYPYSELPELVRITWRLANKSMCNCNFDVLEPVKTSSEDLTSEDWISAIKKEKYRDEANEAERIDALSNKKCENTKDISPV